MKISVIIPVLHEAETINGAIGRLRATLSDGAEIIVVDGGPDGDTLANVRDGCVKGVLCGRGRAGQMNAGAREAGGDVLLFLHADTELPADAARAVADALSGGAVAGAFDLEVAGPGCAFRLIGKAASLRSRLTRIPYGDQAIFVRRGYFLDIGGYRDIPILEDVDLMRRIRDRGDAIHIVRRKVRTSARRWKKEGTLRCTLRNRAIMLLYLLGVSPERIAGWYRPSLSRDGAPPPFQLPPEEGKDGE